MLYELYVENFALIRSLRLPFREGMTALTGETGAGKSLIIDAVSLLIGGRGNDGFIRTGADRCMIEGVFLSPFPDEVRQLLSEEEDPDTLILGRELIRGGRSVARMNGRVIPVGRLKEIGRLLVNIHGQHEHTLLLEENRQLQMLDQFGGEPLLQLAAETASAYMQLTAARKAVADFEEHSAERQQRLDYLQYMITEIEDVAPKEGEDEALAEEARILSYGEKLCDLSSSAYDLFDKTGGSIEQLRRANSLLQDAAKLDPAAEQISERMNNLFYEADDLAKEISLYRDRIDLDAYRLEEVEGRINRLNRLKKKYGGTLDALLYQYGEAKAEAASLEEISFSGDSFRQELARAEKVYAETASRLTAARSAAADALGAAVTAEIRGMLMPNALFTVDLTAHEPSQEGNERVVFMICPNIGEEAQPVSKIASGGELSRILLGIKAILAKMDSVPVLIFDEVDTGLSGRALVAVSQRLAVVGRSAQALAVSHSAVMAAAADNQVFIEKHEEDGRTVMNAHILGEDERVEEIARLIAGDKAGETTLRQAEEMLAQMRQC